MTPQEAVDRVLRGEDLMVGPHTFDPRAREIMCYFKHGDGEEIAVWFNGEQVASFFLRNLDGHEFGTVVVRVPEGAKTVSTDQDGRRVVFA